MNMHFEEASTWTQRLIRPVNPYVIGLFSSMAPRSLNNSTVFSATL